MDRIIRRGFQEHVARTGGVGGALGVPTWSEMTPTMQGVAAAGALTSVVLIVKGSLVASLLVGGATVAYLGMKATEAK